MSRSSRGVCFLSFAFTRKLLGEGFFIRAIRGGVGKSSFKSALCLTSSQILEISLLTFGMGIVGKESKDGSIRWACFLVAVSVLFYV